MSNRYYLAKNFYLEFDISFSKAIMIVAMALLMFFLPVYVRTHLLSSQPQVQTSATGTYTQEALAQASAQATNTGAQVAGVSTTKDAQSSYVQIPVLNLKFDPSFSDPASLPIALGAIFGTVSLLIISVLLIDFIRK
jgi:hypothetical protein